MSESDEVEVDLQVLHDLDLVAPHGSPFKLELKRGGDEYTIEAEHPENIEWDTLAACLDPEALELFVETVLGELPAPITAQQARDLQERWRKHHDLPEFLRVRRLVKVVLKYRDVIEYDLTVICRYDLGELWRARRWRLLMNLIQNLPSNSAYSEAVASDPDFALQLLEAEARGEVDLSTNNRPRRREFGLTESLLTVLANAVIGLRHDHAVANSKKDANIPAPHFLMGPESAMERVRAEREEAKWLADQQTIRAAWWPEGGTLMPTEPDTDQEG